MRELQMPVAKSEMDMKIPTCQEMIVRMQKYPRVVAQNAAVLDCKINPITHCSDEQLSSMESDLVNYAVAFEETKETPLCQP